MKALVTGWFSFVHMGASAGDLMAADVVCSWLRRSACPYDVALAPPFQGGVDWESVAPESYTHLIFVCGPFGRSWQITQFLERFSGCRIVGVDVSMLESLEAWNPFHLLLERDSSRTARPDISLLSTQSKVPVVGVVLIDAQPEYGRADSKEATNDAILRFVASKDLVVVRIDTRLDVNSTGLGSAAQIESLIARMDMVFTTRMHGLVLSLKNGVPVVAVDPVAGGAKVKRQAETLGWPVLNAGSTSQIELDVAYNYCLSPDARAQARECASRAQATLQEAVETFCAEFVREVPSR